MVQADAPTPENVPSLHGGQIADPEGANVPATHCVQTPDTDAPVALDDEPSGQATLFPSIPPGQ